MQSIICLLRCLKELTKLCLIWWCALSDDPLSLPLSQCCRFNYRSTHHLTTNGFYEFLNWFDERAWYPLGRIVGGTVSVSYALFVCVCVCV